MIGLGRPELARSGTIVAPIDGAGPYELDDRALARILAFNDDSRYAYFVARVCETRRVYGLLTGADAWLVWGDEDQDRDVFPAWPHPRLALAAAGDEFEGFVAGSTGLDEFLDFCDVLQADGLLVGVMPYPDGSQLVVEPADLRRDLEDFVDGVYDDVFG